MDLRSAWIQPVCIRPKKKRCLFRVTQPYLEKNTPDPKVFFRILKRIFWKWRKISKNGIFGHIFKNKKINKKNHTDRPYLIFFRPLPETDIFFYYRALSWKQFCSLFLNCSPVRVRPNKKICLFQVTVWKKLGRVGR